MSVLRVASWPGYGMRHNPFMGIFLDALAAADCRVTSLETVEALVAACRGPEAPDMILLHWAERIWGEAGSGVAALAKMKRLLTAVARRQPHQRIVWMVHNLQPHRARGTQRLAWPAYSRTLARLVDGFMTLSPSTVGTVRAALPGLAGKPGIGLWHPAYPDAALSVEDRDAARSARGWGPELRVLGMCGQLSGYKGVEELIATFRKTSDADLRLLLAGRPGPAAFGATLATAAAGDTRIVIEPGDLSASEFRSALGACDVIVAPMRQYLHSGSIVHALSAGRPVLTPRTPFAADLGDLFGAQWLRLYEGSLSAETLVTAARAPATPESPDLTPLDPARIGAKAAAFCRDLVVGQGSFATLR